VYLGFGDVPLVKFGRGWLSGFQGVGAPLGRDGFAGFGDQSIGLTVMFGSGRRSSSGLVVR